MLLSIRAATALPAAPGGSLVGWPSQRAISPRYTAPMPQLQPLITAALLLLALTGSALAEQLKVVSISDGDTFTGLNSQNRQVKVRLHGIDAPEKAQAFGTVSRKALGDLIEGKTVEVQQVDKDRYG